MDDIGFSPAGKEAKRELASHYSDLWIWRCESSSDGSVSIRTGKRIEKGTYVFLEPALFSVDEVNPAKIYNAYLRGRDTDNESWYNDLSYDSDRKTALVGEIEIFIRDHPEKAAVCTELKEDLEDAAKVVAIFERHAQKRPDTEYHDVLRMISWIQRDDDNPNAVLSFNTFRGLWTVHTIEEIEERGAILLSSLFVVLTQQSYGSIVDRSFVVCYMSESLNRYYDVAFDRNRIDSPIQVQKIQTSRMEESGLHYSSQTETQEGDSHTRRRGVYTWHYDDGANAVQTAKDIQKGTMICMESALMSLDKPDPIDVHAAYLNLDQQHRDMYDRFPKAPTFGSLQLTQLTTQIDNFVHDNPKKADDFPELFYSQKARLKMATVLAKFENNAQTRPDNGYREVTRMISWIDHSCKPNAALSYNSSRGMWGVYAIEDIKKERRIKISFIDHTLPYEQRKSVLLSKGVHNCECMACNRKWGHISRDGEKDRQKIDELRQRGKEASPDTRKQLEIYEEMLEKLCQRPEFSEYQCQVHEIVAKLYKDLEQRDRASTNVESAIDLAVKCYGDDGDMTLSLMKLREDIEGS